MIVALYVWYVVNANETLQHKVNELQGREKYIILCFVLSCFVRIDHVEALEEQVARLKEMCKVLAEERDAAVINYAVAEGVCIIE